MQASGRKILGLLTLEGFSQVGHHRIIARKAFHLCYATARQAALPSSRKLRASDSPPSRNHTSSVGTPCVVRSPDCEGSNAMFNSTDLKGAVIGAGILFSSIGITTREAHADGPADPVDRGASPALIENSQDLENHSITSDRLSGPLKGLHPPVYDGPIKWDASATYGELLALGAVLGCTGAGIFGLMSSTARDRYSPDRLRYITAGAVIAFAVPFGLAATSEPVRIVEFPTTVMEIHNETPAHYEQHRSGKVTTSKGPYFGQIVSIAESTIPLASNSYKAPLIPGQKINARFYVDSQDQIISWQAEAAPR